MPTRLVDILLFLGGVLITLFVQWITSRETKWKVAEERRADYARRREPMYAAALDFVFRIEGSSALPAAEKVSREFDQWLFPNTYYFPPSGKEALFTLRNALVMYIVDLSNRSLQKETAQEYRTAIKTAKDYFLNSRDITWYPDELSSEKKKE